MPRVAVIIPTHNRCAFVLEAVQSGLAQTCRDREVIVVDDGSTDGTAAALSERFGDAVRVIQTANRGVSAARNAGVTASQSEWIAFLDSDDLWRPNKLAAQLAHVDAHPGTEICQTEEIWIRRGVRVNPCRHHHKPEGDIFIASLRLCLVSPSAAMLRRALFDAAGGFDETLPVCEDYDLWLRMARHSPVGLIPAPLVVKRGGHPDQLSHRYWGMDRFRITALLKVLSEPLAPDKRVAAATVLREKCEIVALGAEKRGRIEEAQYYRALAAAHGMIDAAA